MGVRYDISNVWGKDEVGDDGVEVTDFCDLQDDDGVKGGIACTFDSSL
jgi:hypothetical protein